MDDCLREAVHRQVTEVGVQGLQLAQGLVEDPVADLRVRGEVVVQAVLMEFEAEPVAQDLQGGGSM